MTLDGQLAIHVPYVELPRYVHVHDGYFMIKPCIKNNVLSYNTPREIC